MLAQLSWAPGSFRSRFPTTISRHSRGSGLPSPRRRGCCSRSSPPYGSYKIVPDFAPRRTGVAATAVLGSRLLTDGLRVEALVLLSGAAALWLGLLVLVLRVRQLPSTGSSFMLTVSVQSLAVLAALASAATHTPWLTYAALAGCVIGSRYTRSRSPALTRMS